jgi:thiazole/oxazole-forming peptide maturase SagD family component
MKLQIRTADVGLSYSTRRLVQRLVSPMCGLDQGIGFLLRDRLEPRFVVSGAQLTGAYQLAGHAQPGEYHIGGTGVTLDEALIRALGETTERYAQVISAVVHTYSTALASHRELTAAGEPTLPADAFRFFAPEEYREPTFPFQPFDPDAPLSWLRVPSILTDEESWVPAQLLLVGYVPRRHLGEPWLLSAVSTGTAAHTDPHLALRNALLELVQIDAAMGHWYSSAPSSSIRLDARTKRLERLIDRTFVPGQPRPTFYWLESAGLAGFPIACVLEERPGKRPAIGVGLGIDLRLERAMYKALLEAVGVIQLAKVTLLNRAVGEGGASIDATSIFDLDSNVAYYAEPGRQARLQEKFPESCEISASSLPPDAVISPPEEVGQLLNGFKAAQLRLFSLDLTTPDLRDLGFVVSRVWSPDTLGLALPSAPPTRHPRFAAYGGVAHREPHPYP